MPLWRQPSPICRVMLNALIPNGIDRRGARNWVSNPALRTMTESSLQRPLKYLPMSPDICTDPEHRRHLPARFADAARWHGAEATRPHRTLNIYEGSPKLYLCREGRNGQTRLRILRGFLHTDSH